MSALEIAVLACAVAIMAACWVAVAVLLARLREPDTDCDEFEANAPRAPIDYDPKR